MTRESILWIALAVLLPGCPADRPAGPAQPVEQAVEQAVEEAPPSDDPLATDNSLCFGDRRTVSLESKVAVGDGTATRVGYRLDLPTAAEDKLVLGVLANIGNSTPATLANLDGFIKAFQE
ncbi:MAG: hypothetical protein QGH45_02215, partial [Myxococcota bacterium]|nr:hypothetical protein [Myxococcota bacterium]